MTVQLRKYVEMDYGDTDNNNSFWQKHKQALDLACLNLH